MKRALSLTLAALIWAGSALAQDDLLNDLKSEDAAKVKENIAAATFKSTRIINMHSVEMTGKGNLQFMIIHHFGPLWEDTKVAGGDLGHNLGRFFGMNGNLANIYMAFDYAPARWLNLGMAFAGQGNLEGTAKFKLLRQQTGQRNIPVSVAFLSVANFNTSKNVESPNGLYWNRFSYMQQLLVARKFSENFSVQLNGAMIHRNIIAYGFENQHNTWSAGVGLRYKLTAKRALSFEFNRQLNMYANVVDKGGNIVNYSPNLFSFGYDWDTGGHIFQFFVTNSGYASNLAQLSQNPVKDGFGQWCLGFNLNRSYTIKHTVKMNK